MLPLVIVIALFIAFLIWFYHSHKPQVDAAIGRLEAQINHSIEAGRSLIAQAEDKTEAQIQAIKDRTAAEVAHLEAKADAVRAATPDAPSAASPAQAS